ncbi:MAG TPA: amino acid permease [Myxococcota bacterium]|jgi:APA family basic amino acid/polyamine antiporter
MPSRLLQRKPLDVFYAEAEGRAGPHALKRALGPVDLVMLGIGGIIGTGIFVLTGVAAVDHAGPGVVASFAVAGLACALAGLCYAEFATLIPISGSAYSYAYATLGEIVAWVIGWDLILEYAVAASAVASGWSGYFRVILHSMGFDLPVAIAHAPGTAEGALVNLPALLVILAVSTLLVIGIRESARANAVIVALKLGVILFVIVAGFNHVDPSNWRPFAPFGWNGIMAGGAIVFFSYIGFDCVTTAAEESRNPERDMPIGILGSLAICTLLYLAVSGIVTGMVPLAQIDRTAPLASAFHDVGLGFAAGLISVGAIVGLTSVLLVLLLGQSRIFLAMSRDGLMPKAFGRIHPRFRTPHVSTILVGLIVAVLSGLTPLTVLVELVSIGTLFAFVLVSAGVLVLRRLQPDLRRPFRCPWVPVVPVLAIAACGYLMASLPAVTWLRFAVWLAIGLAVYYFYGRLHSRLR